MQPLKQSAKKILNQTGLSQVIVNSLLKLHNFSYRKAGQISEWLEPNRVHPKHRLMNYHRWFLENIQPDWTVLDVGCGNGALSADLATHCKKVVGIDFNERKLAQAKKRVPQATFYSGDATKHPFKEKFDAIVLSNVLEHIEDRVGFLKKLKALAPTLLVRVPLITRDWITLYKKERGIEYRLDETHFIEYTGEDFENELKAVGLRATSIEIKFGELYARVVTL